MRSALMFFSPIFHYPDVASGLVKSKQQGSGKSLFVMNIVQERSILIYKIERVQMFIESNVIYLSNGLPESE